MLFLIVIFGVVVNFCNFRWVNSKMILLLLIRFFLECCHIAHTLGGITWTTSNKGEPRVPPSLMDNAEDENTSLPSNLKRVRSLPKKRVLPWVVSWLFEACFLLFQVKKTMYTIMTIWQRTLKQKNTTLPICFRQHYYSLNKQKRLDMWKVNNQSNHF